MAQAQPDFDKLATGIQNICLNVHDAVNEICLIANHPVVNLSNQMNQIMALLVQMQQEDRAFRQEMRAFREEMRERLRVENHRLDIFREETCEGFRIMDIRLDIQYVDVQYIDVQEHNCQARLSNSGIVHNDTALSPLVNGRNQPVPGFPRNLMAINALIANTIAPLLAAYKLDNSGTFDDQKRRFIHYIEARSS